MNVHGNDSSFLSDRVCVNRLVSMLEKAFHTPAKYNLICVLW